MSRPFPLRAHLIRMLGAIALAAMILRGLVPAGYMLAAPTHAGELISVQICRGGSGEANTTVYLNPETGKYVDPDEGPAGSDSDPAAACPFALTAHIALPSLLADTGPAFLTVPVQRASSVAASPGRGLAAPPPPSRAPPLSA